MCPFTMIRVRMHCSIFFLYYNSITPVIRIFLYNQHNNTWMLGSLTLVSREISWSTLEIISTHSCIFFWLNLLSDGFLSLRAWHGFEPCIEHVIARGTSSSTLCRKSCAMSKNLVLFLTVTTLTIQCSKCSPRVVFQFPGTRQFYQNENLMFSQLTSQR